MPDDTRELISRPEFWRWLVVVACAVPALALAAGGAWGARRKNLGAGLARGISVGLTGPAALLLWQIYNRIEDRYGLDSVRALLINLALFVIVGVITGILLRWVWYRTEGRSEEAGAAAAGSAVPAEETGGS